MVTCTIPKNVVGLPLNLSCPLSCHLSTIEKIFVECSCFNCNYKPIFFLFIFFLFLFAFFLGGVFFGDKNDRKI